MKISFITPNHLFSKYTTRTKQKIYRVDVEVYKNVCIPMMVEYRGELYSCYIETVCKCRAFLVFPTFTTTPTIRSIRST